MKNLVIPILCLIFIISCKKKEVEEPVASTPSSTSAFTIKDYMPLKYGNYWVYQGTRTDTNGIVQITWTDSTYVRDSSYVRGRWFYLIDNHQTSAYYFADSANCIIRTDGDLELKLSNNDTIRRDSLIFPGSWCNWTYVMNTNPTTFNFNSNTYTNCITNYCYYKSNLNPYCNDWIIYNTYSPGVGIVYAKYGWINMCDTWEIKLLRYKVN